MSRKVFLKTWELVFPVERFFRSQESVKISWISEIWNIWKLFDGCIFVGWRWKINFLTTFWRLNFRLFDSRWLTHWGPPNSYWCCIVWASVKIAKSRMERQWQDERESQLGRVSHGFHNFNIKMCGICGKADCHPIIGQFSVTVVASVIQRIKFSGTVHCL